MTSVAKVTADITMSPVWCPPSTLLVAESGSEVSLCDPAAAGQVYPSDFHSPVRGSQVCPADVETFVSLMHRVEELGQCQFPRLVLDDAVGSHALPPFVAAFCAQLTPTREHVAIANKLREGIAAMVAGDVVSAVGSVSGAQSVADATNNPFIQAQVTACLAVMDAYNEQYANAAIRFQSCAAACVESGHSALAVKMLSGQILAIVCGSNNQQELHGVVNTALHLLSDHRAIRAFTEVVVKWANTLPRQRVGVKRAAFTEYSSALFGFSDDMAEPVHSVTRCYPAMSSIAVVKSAITLERLEVRVRDFPHAFVAVRNCVGHTSLIMAQQAVASQYHKVGPPSTAQLNCACCSRETPQPLVPCGCCVQRFEVGIRNVVNVSVPVAMCPMKVCRVACVCHSDLFVCSCPHTQTCCRCTALLTSKWTSVPCHTLPAMTT